jgi:DNA-binding beta-propeller fold protein YncE
MVRAAVGAVALAAAGVALAASDEGRIGPSNRIQPNGRQVVPAGELTKLGNAPAGGTLTRDGRYLWTLSAGRGANDIRIVAATGKDRGEVIQKVLMPGLSGGIVMDPSRNVVYVSGVADSSHTDEQVPASIPGRQGDVIQVLRYNRRSGKASREGTIPVPPPATAPPYQEFPPNATATLSWPRDLAISPDGHTLLAALNLADAAAVIDTRTGAVRYVPVGHYPYGAAITRDGRFGLVTSETAGSLSVIDLANASVTGTVQVGPRLSHPEGMVVDPRGHRAFVAIANDDEIAVVDTKSMRVERMLAVGRSEGNGTTPVQVSITHDGCVLISADAGEDALAIYRLPAQRKHCKRTFGGNHWRAWKLAGRVPTAAYPVAAAPTPDNKQLAWIASKGLGVGPNPHGPNPNSRYDNDNQINHFQYLPSIVRGQSGILAFPKVRRLRDLTPKADMEIVPTNRHKPPDGTPLRANGPIKHVFYIVRENRTYDQVLGDVGRGDGDPHLTVFGKKLTPNLHALVRRFPLLDHVYANSEASIDGHYWTAGGAVSDYVIKGWPQNYAGRGRPYDFGAYEVSAPPKGYIFQRLLKANIPFFNYGEALAGLSPFPDKDRTPAQAAVNAEVLAHTDGQVFGGCYDSDIAIFQSLLTPVDVYDSSLPPGADALSHSRFDCFKQRFEDQVAAGNVPTFNYIVLPLDHTQGVSPGARTPDAEVANNDWALGQMVDEISHSPIWKSSLILVQEDDSQDGADHVDAHRIPALAISPYTRKGAVVHTRYDQLSILRTAERVMGLKPKYLGEALAMPMYDAFGRKPSNSAPYHAIVPKVDMTARNPDTAANRRASAGLPMNLPDQVPQRRLDAILWRYRHGPGSKPPPPGPNASPLDGGAGDEGRSGEEANRAAVGRLRRAFRDRRQRAPSATRSPSR